MDLAVWIEVCLVTSLNMLNTVESLSERTFLSSASHACARDAAACATATIS